MFVVSVGALQFLDGLRALIVGFSAGAALRILLLLAFGLPLLRPRFIVSLANTSEVLRFGLYRAGDGLVSFAAQRADQILIAGLLGQEALGIYVFAWRLVMEPIQRINPIFTRVLFPTLAKIKGDLGRIAKAYTTCMKMIATAGLPLIAAIAVTAPTFTPLFFGDQWLPAVPLIQGLAVVSVIRTLINPVGALLLSQGRADLGFRWNVVVACSTVSIVILVGYILADLLALVVFLVMLHCAFLIAHYRVLIRQVIPRLGFRELLSAAATPALFSLAATLPAVVLEHFTEWPGATVLALQVGAGLVVYGSLFALFDRRFLVEIAGLLLDNGKRHISEA